MLPGVSDAKISMRSPPMTLILSMLPMIYRRLNQRGYKTAKRRFGMELNDMILQLIVIFCGGNPDLFFKTG
jgi:hypothetical protein